MPYTVLDFSNRASKEEDGKRCAGNGCRCIESGKQDSNSRTKRYDAQEELRADGRTRENSRKLAGEAEIDGVEELSGHGRAFGSVGGGAG